MSVNNDVQSVHSSANESFSDMMHNDYYSEDSGSTVSRRAYNTPRGFHTVRRVVGRKMVKVSFYETTNTPNNYIRNAVSGAMMPYRVSSLDEDLFFSVLLATGETGPTSALLFYDNPEQYEQHFNVTLPSNAVDDWRVKYFNAIERVKRRRPRNETTKVAVGGVTLPVLRQSYADAYVSGKPTTTKVDVAYTVK
jgi:hypothetical protein